MPGMKAQHIEDVGEPRSGGYRGPPQAAGSDCSRCCGRARSTPLPHDLSRTRSRNIRRLATDRVPPPAGGDASCGWAGPAKVMSGHSAWAVGARPMHKHERRSGFGGAVVSDAGADGLDVGDAGRGLPPSGDGVCGAGNDRGRGCRVAVIGLTE
jgi:hypothetical protein